MLQHRQGICFVYSVLGRVPQWYWGGCRNGIGEGAAMVLGREPQWYWGSAAI